MKIFITGSQGCLGIAMQSLLRKENVNHLGVDIQQLDISDFKRLNETIINYKPDIILHFAALSDVDTCEREPEMAFRINALATLGIATIARKLNAKLLYTSTNFVFDGNTEKPYYEYDQPNPISEYGKTKYLGEKYIREVNNRFYIVRTSWLFGKNAKTFASRFLQQEEKPRSISVICDQIGSFTYVSDLAEAIFNIIKSENYGTYHIANGDYGTWLDFLLKAKEIMKFNTELIPVKTDELSLPAPRPKFAPLGSKNYEFLFDKKMRPWQNALVDFIKTLKI
jgi:dTDP-4-dehydrorhamnose reductase|uniref:dTDP-4-dehydrorhamnose reductase n=1 Tax=candidate division WOR-3 bacterium TaxID=2052148 RepID=A0A7C6EK18_UNCW3